MKKLKLELVHTYLPFAALLIVLSFINRGDKNAQLTILTVGMFAYLLVGLFHHKKDRSLTMQTALEYILVAVLAIIVLFIANWL